jgi:hypothetical protein
MALDPTETHAIARRSIDDTIERNTRKRCRPSCSGDAGTFDLDVVKLRSTPVISWFRPRYAHTSDFRPTGTVAAMSLVEWLRTPRYLKARLMMESRPLSRADMEVVFLEVRGGSALVRLPVMLLFLPKANRSSQDLPSPPEKDTNR